MAKCFHTLKIELDFFFAPKNLHDSHNSCTVWAKNEEDQPCGQSKNDVECRNVGSERCPVDPLGDRYPYAIIK
jgi:hypothetical protein